MTGCLTTRGRLERVVASKDDVVTAQVCSLRKLRGRLLGRYLNTRVEDENKVNPVSFGEGVTAVKNWNLVSWLAECY